MMTNIAHTCAPRIKKELSALRHLVIQFDSASVHLFHIPRGALEGPIKLHWKWNCKWSWLNMEMTKIKSARLRGTLKISYLWLRCIILEVAAWLYDLLVAKQCQFSARKGEGEEEAGRDACHLISTDTLPINKQLKHVLPVGRLPLCCPVPVPDTQKYLTMTKEYLKS